jgi:DNA-binding transcriptional LysR family regulator
MSATAPIRKYRAREVIAALFSFCCNPACIAVGAALFIRTTRSVGLTEAGERFISRAKPAFEELVAAGEAARDLGQRPAGLLRLSVPRAVVPLILEPVIASFCQAYPEVELEIAASEGLVDLAAEGFDAGIRLGQLIAADMVTVRLTPPFPLVVVGSPDYLARHGRPERVDELRHHACLRMRRSNGAIAPWPFVDGNRTIEAIVSGPLTAHDYPTLLGAAIQGVGLAQVPGPLAEAPIADGRLQVYPVRRSTSLEKGQLANTSGSMHRPWRSFV